MSTAYEHERASEGGAARPAADAVAGNAGAATAASVTGEQVWRALSEASFAVVSYVTPAGEPRSSGVVYALAGRRLYLAVATDSWKARHIAASGRVAVTVLVRRGGLLSLIFPIPPATVSFHGSAIVHPPGQVADHGVPKQLTPLLPAERQAMSRIIEIHPEGDFLTYGLGVSLARMRHPSAARARVPVGALVPAPAASAR
jgi:hypothetical protein